MTFPAPSIRLIGAGAIAGSHLTALRNHPEFAGIPVHIYDLRPEAATALAAQHPGAVAVDAGAILADADGAILVVATPPVAHLDWTLRGFAAGCHVLCEKPLALSIDEGRRMLAAAQAAQRRLACCSARFAGEGRHGAAALRDKIAAGRLGRVYRARSSFRWCRSRSGVEYQPTSRWFLRKAVNGGGALADWGPYDISALIDVLRPVAVEVLAAWTSQPRTSLDDNLDADVEFHVGATMRWRQANGNEVIVDLERGSCHHGEGSSICDFEGLTSGARLTWLGGPDNDDPVTLYVDRAGKNETEPLPTPSNPLPGMDRPLIGLLRHLADGSASGVFDADAELGNAVLHAIYASASTRQPITVTRSIA